MPLLASIITIVATRGQLSAAQQRELLHAIHHIILQTSILDDLSAETMGLIAQAVPRQRRLQIQWILRDLDDRIAALLDTAHDTVHLLPLPEAQ
ncbi:MAG: hypothetical protein ACRETL_13080 [Gammaproteobacteria bacterium]